MDLLFSGIFQFYFIRILRENEKMEERKRMFRTNRSLVGEIYK